VNKENPVIFDKSALFDALFEHSGEAVLVVDASTLSIAAANPIASHLLADDEESLLGTHFLDLGIDSNRSILEAFVQEFLATQEDNSLTIRLKNRMFRSIPCNLHFKSIDVSGNKHLLVTLQDLTERMRAKAEIEMRDIAIGNVESGVTIADARQKDLPLIYVNHGFEVITGYSAREAIGHSCRFLQGKDTAQPQLDVLRNCLKEGKGCVVQLKNYRKNGSLFYNELHLSPIFNDENELTHFVGIQLDVTEREEARKSLERSEKRYRQALQQEQELNEIKTRFISMISHEFRTPMTGIQASSALLKRFGDKLKQNKKTQHLENIENSLRRMNRLLDDVLFFSRAEADKLNVSRIEINIDAYFAKLLETLSPIYPDRVIHFKNLGTVSKSFLLDEHLLDHVFHNLIGNALKYSPPDKPVICTVSSDSSTLTFEIRDEGIGIPKVDQERLFDAFHRADNVGNRQGTGLGLNIALRAASLLKGSIYFSSVENHGSTFRVNFPILNQNSLS